jgi:5'(3')-deoxyribonucleotidase
MNKLRIGLDVDGVLRDFVGKIVELSTNELGYKPNFNLRDYKFLRSALVNGETIAHKIWGSGEWLIHVTALAPVLSKAREGYQLIANDPRFDLYIVSAQNKGTEQHTDEWLEQNGFVNHVKAIYTHEKTKAPCQVLIDDKIENIREYEAQHRLGILINQPWNEEIKHPYRVNNLVEAYELLINYHESQTLS